MNSYLVIAVGSLVGALLACFVLLILVVLWKTGILHRYFSSAIKQLPLETVFHELLTNKKTEQEISGLIDQRLDKLIQTLRMQIPMGGMFLTGSLSEKIKTQAKEELIKLLPDLGQMFAQKIQNDCEISDLLINRRVVPRSFLKRFGALLIIIGATFGFFISLIQSIFMN